MLSCLISHLNDDDIASNFPYLAKLSRCEVPSQSRPFRKEYLPLENSLQPQGESNWMHWSSGGSRRGWEASVAPFWFFFFYKSEVYQQKVVLNEYEICLKMLEMATSETQIFKNVWGACPQNPLENSRLRRSLVPPPPPPLWKSWISACDLISKAISQFGRQKTGSC